ncbi:MAG: hypothetical protein AB7E09_02885 [Candidatus Izemoplasmatales bacterium]
MKKLLMFLFAALLMLGIVACNGDETTLEPTDAPTTTEEPTEEPTEAPTEEPSEFQVDGDFTAFDIHEHSNGSPMITSVTVTIENGEVAGFYIDALQSNGTTFEWNPKTKKELGDAYGMVDRGGAIAEWYEQAALIEAYWLANGFDSVTVDESNVIDNVAGVTIKDGNYTTLAAEAIQLAKDGKFQAYHPSMSHGKPQVTWVEMTMNTNGTIESMMLDVLQSTITEGAFAWNEKSKQELGDEYGMVERGGAEYEWYEQANFITDFVIENGFDALETIEVEGSLELDNVANVSITVDDYMVVLRDVNIKAGEREMFPLDGEFTAFDVHLHSNGAPMITSVTVTIENGQVVAYYIDALQSNGTTFEWNPKTKKELGDAYGMVDRGGAIAEWYEQAALIEAYWLENGVKSVTTDESTVIDNVAGVTIKDGGYTALAAEAVELAKNGIFQAYTPSMSHGKPQVTWAVLEMKVNGAIENLTLDVLQSTITEGVFAWNPLTKQELGYDYGMVERGGAEYEWFEQANFITDFVIENGFDALETIEVEGSLELDNVANVSITVDDYMVVLRDVNIKAGEREMFPLDGEFTAFDIHDHHGAPMITSVTVTVENGQIVAYYIDALQSDADTFEWNALTKKELGDDYGMVEYGGAIAEWYEQAALIEAYWLENGVKSVTTDETTVIDNVAGVTIKDGGYTALAAEAVELAKNGIFQSYTPSMSHGKPQVTWVVLEMKADASIEKLTLDVLQSTITEGVFAWNPLTKQELGFDYGMVANGGATLEWFEQANLITDFVIENGVDALSTIEVEGSLELDNVTGVSITVDDYIIVLEDVFTKVTE